MSLPGNLYDGHTLGAQLDQVARVTGRKPARAYVDRGYRGHGISEQAIYVSRTRGITSPTIKRELKRRNTIEPVIGHMKEDGKLERHWLKQAHDDAINVVLVATGHNVRLLLNWLRRCLALIPCIVAALIELAMAQPSRRPSRPRQMLDQIVPAWIVTRF